MPAIIKSEIDMESILNQDNDQRMVEEANQQPTLLPGMYRLTATNITFVQQPKTNPGDPGATKVRFPGRSEFRVRFAAQSLDDPKRKGGVFVTVTPERSMIQPKDGEPFLDSASRLWGNICKAFGTEKGTVGKTISALAEFPLEGQVEEVFRAPDGSYVNPANTEEREALIAMGAKIYNNVKWLGAAKAR